MKILAIMVLLCLGAVFWLLGFAGAEVVGEHLKRDQETAYSMRATALTMSLAALLMLMLASYLIGQLSITGLV
ncbi:MAG: hypothetical protein E6Q97_00695 [Desulfurellales bacterium]|nr:MAG: hypothetical protein E6Q97_00695 [Desulfurellales bacterium]